jgi:hypothetical protein
MNTHINTKQKGIILFTIGIFLLLHTLGIITRGIDIALIGISLGLIIYGAQLSGIYDFIYSLVKKYIK